MTIGGTMAFANYVQDKIIEYREWIKLALLIGICIILLSALSGISSAATPVYELHQGDTAYLGDTVDVSLVVAWPDYELAWCPRLSGECSSPVIYDMSSFQHKKYLDPAIYKVGDYYRWDGSWHRAENSFAFELQEGPRPYNETLEAIYADNETYAKEPTRPANRTYYSTSAIIARGDEIVFAYSNASLTNAGNAYLWLFGTSPAISANPIYGTKIPVRLNDSAYYYTFNYSSTRDMEEGQYRGYIQFQGFNGVPDIFYREDHRVDEDYRGRVLDTIFDDGDIADVPLNGLLPTVQYDRFNTLLQSTNLFDDAMLPVNVTVMSPGLTMTEYYEMEDTLYIEGVTSMAPGTVVTVKLDPDNYALKSDIADHTWTTTVTGEISAMRKFSIAIPINWDEISIGEHTVVASVDKYGIHTEATKNWRATDTYVMPTPTPKRERVIVEDYGWHRITPTTATPVPVGAAATTGASSNITAVMNQSVNGTVNSAGLNAAGNVTSNVTGNTTINAPAITKTITKTTTRDQNIHVPISPWVPVLSIAALLIIIRRKESK